jgi:RNA-directed DNA polymerase
VQESSFLGFTFKGGKLTATTKAIMGFKRRVRRLTGRSWGISMQNRYGHIRTYIRGWINYFGIGMRYNDAVELDHWLRRRIRMCYLKQWGRARKRIGELIRLGSPKHQAILTGLSRKGYWHLAKTYATNCGLSKEYLQDLAVQTLQRSPSAHRRRVRVRRLRLPGRWVRAPR